MSTGVSSPRASLPRGRFYSHVVPRLAERDAASTQEQQQQHALELGDGDTHRVTVIPMQRQVEEPSAVDASLVADSSGGESSDDDEEEAIHSAYASPRSVGASPRTPRRRIHPGSPRTAMASPLSQPWPAAVPASPGRSSARSFRLQVPHAASADDRQGSHDTLQSTHRSSLMANLYGDHSQSTEHSSLAADAASAAAEQARLQREADEADGVGLTGEQWLQRQAKLKRVGAAGTRATAAAAQPHAQESKEQSTRVPPSPRAASQSQFTNAVMQSLQPYPPSTRPSTGGRQRSAAEVLRSSTAFAQLRPASAGPARTAAPGAKLSPRSAVAAMAQSHHEARLLDVEEREARVNLALQDSTAVRSNHAEQMAALARLQADMEGEGDEQEFLSPHSGEASLSARVIEARKAAAQSSKAQRARDLARVGLRGIGEDDASSVLRGVSGWIEGRSLEGGLDEAILLRRGETQAEETESVRADAARALDGVVSRIVVPPALRLELMHKFQSSTGQAVADREALIETLKRNLWKARYYLRDSVHLFEAERSSLQGQLDHSRAEVARLNHLDVENTSLRMERARVVEELHAAKESSRRAERELFDLQQATSNAREHMDRLVQNDSLLREMKDKSQSEVRSLGERLAKALSEAASLREQISAAADRATKHARSMKLREAQLDAVNEMFRSRRELLTTLREQKKREEEQAAAARVAAERAAVAAKVAAANAAAAAAHATAAEGESSTFLTEPKPDSISVTTAAPADPAPPSPAAAPADPTPSSLLLDHIRINKKLYRILQLHSENASKRPDMMVELKEWILSAERQLRAALESQIVGAGTDAGAEGGGNEGQPTSGAWSVAQLAALKLEQLRQLDEQRSKFRFLAESSSEGGSLAETPERTARRKQEAEENEQLLQLLQEGEERGVSSEEEAEEERQRMREELGIAAGTGDELADAKALQRLLDDEAALDAADARRMTDAERAAKLRRALERVSMTPADAKADRRKERAEVRERKRARRQAMRDAEAQQAMVAIDVAARALAEELGGATGTAAPDGGQGAGNIMEQSDVELRTLVSAATSRRSTAANKSRAPTPSYMSPLSRSRAASRGAGSDTPKSALSPAQRSRALMHRAKSTSGEGRDELSSGKKQRRPQSAGAARLSKASSPMHSPKLKVRTVKASAKEGSKMQRPASALDRLDELSLDASSAAGTATEDTDVATATEGEDEQGSLSDSPGSAPVAPSKRSSGRGKKKGSRSSVSPTPATSAPVSFLPAQYRSAAASASDAFVSPTPAESPSAWPGASFFTAPIDALAAARQKAEFELRVTHAARAMFDTWVTEQAALKGKGRREQGVQCPDALVSQQELHVLEHFCEMPAIEAPVDALTPAEGVTAEGTRVSAVSRRTIGLQVGLPPAFAHVTFYRAYLDALLASLRAGGKVTASSGITASLRSTPARGPLEVDPPASLYAFLGADKTDSMESATIAALNLLVPFDPTVQMRALVAEPRKEVKGKGKDAAADAATISADSDSSDATTDASHAAAPWHPLGVSGEERVLSSRGVAAIPDSAAATDGSSAAGVRSTTDTEMEAQTDSELNSFMSGLDKLPNPAGSGAKWFNEGHSAKLAEATHPVASATASDRSQNIAAIIALVSDIDRARRVKEATLAHRQQTLQFLDGQTTRKPPSLASVLAKLGLSEDTAGGRKGAPTRAAGRRTEDASPTVADAAESSLDATLASMSRNPPGRALRSLAGDPLVAAAARANVLAQKLARGAVLPAAGGLGRMLDSSAQAMIAHHAVTAPPQPSAAAGMNASDAQFPRHRAPVLHFAFQPVPFGKAPYAMRTPLTLQPPQDIGAVYEYINARAGLEQRAANAGHAVHAQHAADQLDARWMDSVRARLWSTHDLLLQRRQQLMRGMIGPAREKMIYELGGRIVGDAHASEQQQQRAQHVAADATTARAFEKLELYARLRTQQQQQQQQQQTVAPHLVGSTSVPPTDASAAVRSTLLDRLRAQETALAAMHSATPVRPDKPEVVAVPLMPQPPAAAVPARPTDGRTSTSAGSSSRAISIARQRRATRE